jgi:hypothetical protein
VTYEDLTTHTQAVGEKVMKYLTGDATTHKFSTTATDVIKVEKQDNALNDDFRTRFFARLKFERAGVNKKLLAYQEEE